MAKVLGWLLYLKLPIECNEMHSEGKGRSEGLCEKVKGIRLTLICAALFDPYTYIYMYGLEWYMYIPSIVPSC